MHPEPLPKSKLFALAAGVALAVALVPALIPAGAGASVDVSSLKSGATWGGVALVFLGGLLTALTPCVYPLIPVTVGIFGARKAERRSTAFLLTGAYVLGLCSVFTTLGVIAGTSGKAFGALLGRPEVALVLAAFLVLLASSMFGAFELELPPSLAARLSRVGGGGPLGAFLMGGASGFLAAPCTGPVLTGLLTFVATSRNVPLGALLLFVYALGIGVPFVLLGVFAVRLPKAGVWMDWTKSALGVLLLALAFTYARDAFPAARALTGGLAAALGRAPGIALAAVLAAVGVAWGAIHLSFSHTWSDRLAKAGGVALLVVALVIRLAALNAPAQGQWWVRLGWQRPALPQAIVWKVQFGAMDDQLATFERALSQAKSEGRPVMIDFFADWCAACLELDRETYVAPTVVAEGQRFFTIKVDGTNEQDAVEALYRRFGVQGLPTVAFVASNGEVLASPRVTGFLNAEKFVDVLRRVR